ncbi:MAG: metallophosphoesterase [Planctomycetota bacterium]
MITVSLLYNFLMAAVDAAALVYLAYHRTPTACFWVRLAALTAGVGLALAMAVVFERPVIFAAMRLLAYALFLHAPVVLAGSAALAWQTQPKTAVASVALAGLLVAVAIDAFWIEPTWLEISRLRVTSEKITRPVRIVLVADLQTDTIGSYEQRVLRLALQQKPDVILLAGDYLDAEGDEWEDLRTQLHALLAALDFSAPLGVYAVRGNVDPGDWQRIFEGLPITTVGPTDSFKAADLRLTCLSAKDSFNASLQIGSDDPERFHVVLGHSPNYALGDIEADLLLAGHTHGGQVRLPLLGPLMSLSEVPRGWAAGATDLPRGGKLVVSRGIGMERGAAPRLRFLCRPELVVIDLTPR